MKRSIGRWLVVFVPIALVGCTAPETPSPVEGRDPHSFSRPDEAVVRHLSLDLDVDFESRRLAGTATLTIENLAGTDELWLDAWGLDVKSVDFGDEASPTSFRLGDERPYLGGPLVVAIRPDTTAVRVRYASRPDAAALQWLEPRQTAGKRHPFLLSQSQAVLARTWIPLQDTPGVRVTYDATLRVPPELLALMSAENPTKKSDDGVYRFHMPQPIPSYLLAVAVGDVVFAPLGRRCGVYAEPEVIEAAAWEFAETERMMELAERLYGPYRWERYDLIVLPPSFPYGGMENPRLTFATPTILAGDRSLVALVAHELAHSWSGNLVTNATWNDFWLNEGFTSYFEYRIMEELKGRGYVEMLWLLGKRGMEEEIADTPAEDTRLRVDFAGRDPDATPGIVYDKGALFLRLLEERFGRGRWDAFLSKYFDRHAFSTMTTKRFLAELRAAFEDDRDWLDGAIETWVYGPGVPDSVPAIESPAFEEVERRRDAWLAGGDPPAEDDWSSHEWVHFVRTLPDSLPVARFAELDDAYRLSDSGNAELLTAWLERTLAAGYDPAWVAAESFVTSMGRAKFLRPIYGAMCETVEGCDKARAIYESAKPGYHPVAVTSVDRMFESLSHSE